MDLVIASRNAGKVAIYKELLAGSGINVISLSETDSKISVEETGSTTIENARLKAVAYANELKTNVLANDSGLTIEKFSPENQPGVFVRRYGGGKELSDEDTIEIYNRLFNEVGGESNGVFSIALAIVDSEGNLYEKEFLSHRFFKAPPCKERMKGLPLRSFEFSKEQNKFVAQMTLKEQNQNEGQCLIDEGEWIKSVLLK